MALMHCGHPNTAMFINDWTGERYCMACRAEQEKAKRAEQQPVGVAYGEGCRETRSGLHGDIKHSGRCEFCGEWIVRSNVRSVEQLLDKEPQE